MIDSDCESHVHLAMISPESKLTVIPGFNCKVCYTMDNDYPIICYLFAFSLCRGELGRPGEGVDDISINSGNIQQR